MRALLCTSCGGALDPEARLCPHCRTGVATRRCGICFDLNLVDDRNCRSCGAALPLEDPVTRPDRLGCPGCGAAMTPRRLAGSSFDECDACGGLWLSRETSAGVASKAETRAQLRVLELHSAPRPTGPDPAKVTYRPCPICRKMMNRSQYAQGSGVVVDLCKTHGTYYDRGELTRIVDFIENGGLEKARRREAESLREDLRDLRRKAILAGAAADPALDSPPAPAERIVALDLIRYIADYLSGKRSANSG